MFWAAELLLGGIRSLDICRPSFDTGDGEGRRQCLDDFVADLLLINILLYL